MHLVHPWKPNSEIKRVVSYNLPAGDKGFKDIKIIHNITLQEKYLKVSPQYAFLRFIAAGGHSVVAQVRDTQTEEVFAMKCKVMTKTSLSNQEKLNDLKFMQYLESKIYKYKLCIGIPKYYYCFKSKKLPDRDGLWDEFLNQINMIKSKEAYKKVDPKDFVYLYICMELCSDDSLIHFNTKLSNTFDIEKKANHIIEFTSH